MTRSVVASNLNGALSATAQVCWVTRVVAGERFLACSVGRMCQLEWKPALSQRATTFPRKRGSRGAHGRVVGLWRRAAFVRITSHSCGRPETQQLWQAVARAPHNSIVGPPESTRSWRARHRSACGHCSTGSFDTIRLDCSFSCRCSSLLCCGLATTLPDQLAYVEATQFSGPQGRCGQSSDRAST